MLINADYNVTHSETMFVGGEASEDCRDCDFVIKECDL
jgi:hypothetical protein